MRSHTLLFLLFTCISLPTFLAVAQEPNDKEGKVRYISDDLFTFLHAGPGRNYRILGSVIAGTKVKMLQEDTETQFIEVIDDKQRTGWVQTEFISKTRSVRELVPGLTQKLQEANAMIKQQSADNDLLNQRIADLSSQNAALNRKQEEIAAHNKRISAELANQDQSAQIEWFTRGGIVAVVSLLLGIILTYLPKKRRRNDNWM
ncbi:TIGR04211 family SH3 domain-containing protein [Paraglaciecola hydrolytica]|uniref:Peptide-binding protein n=1 Tax=Paraglaciecola hydrolytica TaxID=1799789 RepID=A0A136A2Z7_9ALTE|nr:TIGR04211 family SH3 domain-containing protein [Paraglaciecola hydrolytica]KXI29606.1 peptide-binding protein [Paraglaciecola hydrolytica]